MFYSRVGSRDTAITVIYKYSPNFTNMICDTD